MKRGVTLVEVMVVTGIIGVMAAVAIPTVVATKAQGQKSVCLNNIKNLTTVITLWSDDHNGALPKEDRNVPRNLIKPDYFRGDLYREINFPVAIWKCPNRPVLRQVNGASHGSEYDFGIKNWETSYFYTANGYGTLSASPEPTSPTKIRPTRLDSINSKRVLFADKVCFQATSGVWEINHQKATGRSPVEIQGGNIGYVDGRGHWQGAGHYPKFLVIDPNPRGNAESVHDPVDFRYSHRYWW